MQLLLPTNWDRELIPLLGEIKADIQIYGVLPTSMIGSGGSGPDISRMTVSDAEDYVGLAHSAGFRFNYLLNAPCLNNMEWNNDTHRELLQHLEWLCEIGVDSVTVAIPYLVELIKRQFPHLKVEASTIMHANSVARARFLESLGVDSIMLHSNVNRDFELLKAIRRSVKCELGLLTNSLCLFQCPYEYYHNNTLGHASQGQNPSNGFYMDYCVMHCALCSLTDKSQLIKSRWIRPEDVHLYQEIGIDFFKIGGRAMSTKWIVNATKAYSSASYPGNLYDILSTLTSKFRSPESSLPMAQTSAIASPPKVYIDNKSLDGFVEFFKKQDCLSGCSNCTYCQEVADKVVRIDKDEADKYISVLQSLLDSLTNSSMFQAKDTCAISKIGM